MLYSFADTQIAIEELRKSYLDDFIDVIGANLAEERRMQKLPDQMRAEKEFGRRMMERMKGKDRPRDKGPLGRLSNQRTRILVWLDKKIYQDAQCAISTASQCS